MKKLFTLAIIILGFTLSSSAQNGLNFDGGNDIVQTSYTGVMGSLNRTFEAWVFVPSSAPSSNLAIMDYGLNAVGSRNSFSVSGSRGLTFISGGTNANIGTAANVVPLNQWVHVAFVLNSGTGYLYVNGTQVGTGSLTTVNTPSGNANVRVGQRVSGGSIPFNGSIDEVRMWDVARTPAQIQSNMNKEFCSPQQNLQLYLKFNEGTAGGNNAGVTTAIDASGNNYNGTLSNFSLSGTSSNWVAGATLSNGSTSSTVIQTACDSFSLSANSTVYTTTGVYTEVLTNVVGCDSTITLNLTITNSNSGTDTQSACDSYTWIDGNTYTSSNNSATFTVTNAAGCDSIITLNLTIDTVNNSVTQDSATLTANDANATYQWVECPSMTPVGGATSQLFTPTASGDYAVIVTNNQCVDTSACYNVTLVGTSELEFGSNFKVFPNPTYGEFAIDLGEMYPSTTVTITDLTGKVILSTNYESRQFMNLTLNEPAGVYLLVIQSKDKRAVVRLVKQ